MQPCTKCERHCFEVVFSDGYSRILTAVLAGAETIEGIAKRTDYSRRTVETKLASLVDMNFVRLDNTKHTFEDSPFRGRQTHHYRVVAFPSNIYRDYEEGVTRLDLAVTEHLCISCRERCDFFGDVVSNGVFRVRTLSKPIGAGDERVSVSMCRPNFK